MAKPVTLTEAMDDWCKVVMLGQPTANPTYVHTVCEEIVRRAHILAEQNRLNRSEVTAFLLTRSRAWVMSGLPVSKIGEKMPKTLGDLGMLKIAEGGAHGEALSIPDLKTALARPQHRIIQ